MSNREQYAPGAASGAEVRKDGEQWTLVLVRDLPHPPAKVWKADGPGPCRSLPRDAPPNHISARAAARDRIILRAAGISPLEHVAEKCPRRLGQGDVSQSHRPGPSCERIHELARSAWLSTEFPDEPATQVGHQVQVPAEAGAKA